jgi:hypothetical protein
VSLAGRPKTVAAKARQVAVSKAHVAYRDAAAPIQREMQRMLAEALAPHQEELNARIRAADLAYFEAIGDTESARLIKGSV